MAEDLPEAARHLLQTIDIQLDLIAIGNHFQNDETYALTQQREALEEWKRQILAEPSSVLPASDIKLEDNADAEPEEALVRQPKRGKRKRITECCTCLETFNLSQTVKLRCCSTRYCRSCFREWFSTALDTKQLPKCCDVGIEPKDYNHHLNAAIKKKYKAVTAELDAERRLWCSNPACRAFIKIEHDASGFISCTRCRRKTCASCFMNVASHKGRNKACASYVSDDALNKAIEANNWKRCPRCHIPVEKTEGCRNIRCTCGTIFCFGCGISKPSEFAECRCSNPGMVVNEPVENPIEDDWHAPLIAPVHPPPFLAVTAPRPGVQRRFRR